MLSTPHWTRATRGILAALALTLALTPPAHSQGGLAALSDTLGTALQEIRQELQDMERLRISGLLQTQFQHIQTPGAASVVGGDFLSGVDNRIGLRRGRLRASYRGDRADYVFELDLVGRGIDVKDAFIRLNDPWLNSFRLTAGNFKRPFGYMVLESARRREAPEVSRAVNTLVPGDHDIGAMLSFRPPRGSALRFLEADLGMFNGTGPARVDFDRFKDLISSVAVNHSLLNGLIDLRARTSFLYGGHRQPTRNVYTLEQVRGQWGFAVDSAAANEGAIARRVYLGADLQLAIHTPMGTTEIKAEYMQGQQPGTLVSSRTPESSPTVTRQPDRAVVPADTYLRPFSGGYIYLVQRIGRSSHRLMAKYDWYDPNTQMSGNQIGEQGSGLGDVMYTNIGFGWLYDIDQQLRLTVYYDMPRNETTQSLDGFNADIEDNVLTVRLQFAF